LAKKEQNIERTKEIENLGIQLIRFNNEEVEKNCDTVAAAITEKVKTFLNLGE
jgi:very-short-patch-repair endonuclease